MSKGLALRVGNSPEGLPIFAKLDGKCSPPLEAGDRGAALVVGKTADGKPILAWSDQRCAEGTNEFEIGKKYLGIVTGVTEDGLPIITSWCKRCGGPPVTICDCEICCTLDATVRMPGGSPQGITGGQTSWDAARNATLICGSTFEGWWGVWTCFNEETGEYQSAGYVEFTGRDGDYDWDFGAPYGVVPVTIKSDIWLSEEFAYDWWYLFDHRPSTPARVAFLAAEYSYTTDTLHTGCFYRVFVQHKIETSYLVGPVWVTKCYASGGTNPFAGVLVPGGPDGPALGDLRFLFEAVIPDDPVPEEPFDECSHLAETGEEFDCAPGVGVISICPLSASLVSSSANSGHPACESFKCCWVQIRDNCTPPETIGCCPDFECLDCQRLRYDVSFSVSDCVYITDCLEVSGYNESPPNVNCFCPADNGSFSADTLEPADDPCVESSGPDAECEGGWTAMFDRSGRLFCSHNLDEGGMIDYSQDAWYIQAGFTCYECEATGEIQVVFCAGIQFYEGVPGPFPPVANPSWTAIFKQDSPDFATHSCDPPVFEAIDVSASSYTEYNGLAADMTTVLPVTHGCSGVKMSGLWTKTCVDQEPPE